MKRDWWLRWFGRILMVCAFTIGPGWANWGIGSAASDWQSGWPSGAPDNTITALGLVPGGTHAALAATSAALYRSADHGATWSVLAGSPKNIAALAVADASTLFAYSWPPFDAPSGTPKGLFKSTDGGSTWQDPTGGASADQLGQVRTLVILPGNPQVVLAGAASFPAWGNKISRSSDGGVNWTAVYTITPTMGAGSVTEIVPAPSKPNVFYAPIQLYHSGAILKSSDGGQTWESLAGGVEPLGYTGALAVDANDANRVLAMSQGPLGNGLRLFKSTDGGQTWSKTGSGLPQTDAVVQDLAVDPTNGNLVFATVSGANGGIYRSDDGGETWSLLDGQLPNTVKNARFLAFEPQSRTLFAGTDSGVWQRPIARPVAQPFRDYYTRHDGLRVLGDPLTELTTADGWPSQYFEKGRLEDHSRVVSDPNWRFMFGLLADELQNAKVPLPVGGEVSTVSYADLNLLADKSKRIPPPQNFGGGVWPNPDGSYFVPYDPNLAKEAGHNVPPVFWNYINRADLFPGGWLHDLGLPMTEPVQAVVDKGDLKGRPILVQMFQRTILTYDAQNPAAWQVERANIGTDYVKALVK